ncbi:MAG: aldo/keto reductase, partial [Candidatus Brocadiaceae bacterium]
MEKRALGKTGMRVSAIGFGGAPLGLQGYLDAEDKSSAAFERRAQAAVVTAFELGINFFDTAPGYGDGRSEEIIGRALEEHRDEVLLATKFHQWREEDPGGARETFERSLRLLRTDHVDLLQVHGGLFTDRDADLLLGSPVLDWARRERERGRCRHLGITAETTSGALERLLQTGIFETLQIAYGFIYQCHCDYQRGPKGIIPLARDLGIGILSMRTATSGFLQRVLTAEFPRLSAEAVTELAIRFVLSTPEVDCALVGMKRAEEVVANVRLAEDLTNRL